MYRGSLKVVIRTRPRSILVGTFIVYTNTFAFFRRFRQRRDLSQRCLVFRLRNLKTISASGKNMHKIFYLLIHCGGGSSRERRDTLDGTRTRVDVCVTVTETML